MTALTPEVAIDQVIAELLTPKLGQKLPQRLGPAEVRSHLGDLCGLLECHFLDLPVQVADLALRDVNTSRSDLIDVLLEIRERPLVAA